MIFENIAEIGDTIRVYDVQPGTDRGDCYIEGVVVAKHRKIVRYTEETVEVVQRVILSDRNRPVQRAK